MGPEFAFPHVMTKIDLSNFFGTWYLAAETPHPFDKRRFGPVDGYRLQPDGTVLGFYGSSEPREGGARRRFSTKVWSIDIGKSNERDALFTWPIRCRYQVLELGPQLSYCVLGHASNKYAWILSRASSLAEEILADIFARLELLGYDTSTLRLKATYNRSA